MKSPGLKRSFIKQTGYCAERLGSVSTPTLTAAKIHQTLIRALLIGTQRPGPLPPQRSEHQLKTADTQPPSHNKHWIHVHLGRQELKVA